MSETAAAIALRHDLADLAIDATGDPVRAGAALIDAGFQVLAEESDIPFAASVLREIVEGIEAHLAGTLAVQ